ncbi:MAG: 4-hydroxy-tetrahydrodipicolinate synthase [Acidobacteriota bacterium]
MTASTPVPQPATPTGPSFEGLWVALATPFDADGDFDEPAYRRLIRHVVDGGVQGLLALGSTGEAATLNDAERDRVVATCLDEVATLGVDVPVLVGTGSNATPRAIAWTRRAAALGAQGALVVTPFYNKPNPDGMVAHYSAVAEAAPELPLVIYNVPGRTGTNLGPELLDRLWQLPTAVALKESSGNLGQIDAIVRHLPAGKIVLSGDDPYALPSIALGAQGLVSVMANLVPAETRALVDAALDSRFDVARHHHLRLSPLMEALFVESNPVPLKAALHLRGLTSDIVRAPLATASTETRRRVYAVLAELERVAA